MLYGITQSYLPPVRGSISRPYPGHCYDRYSIYPPIKDERLSRPETTEVKELSRAATTTMKTTQVCNISYNVEMSLNYSLGSEQTLTSQLSLHHSNLAFDWAPA